MQTSLNTQFKRSFPLAKVLYLIRPGFAVYNLGKMKMIGRSALFCQVHGDCIFGNPRVSIL